MMNSDTPSALCIAYSSALASILSTFVSNPFEVLKIRLQADKLQCDLHELSRSDVHQKSFKYVHEVALSSEPLPSRKSSRAQNILKWQRLFRKSTQAYVSNPFIRVYSACTCISAKESLAKAFRHIYVNEGPLTFLNGWRYAVLQAGASNILYFSFYEKTKTYLGEQQLPQSRFLVPWLASGISRSLTTTITFPLEYWKVLQSSTKGYTKKNNVDLGTRLHSAYVITVQRDVLFSVIYWSLLENFKMELLKLIEGQHELVNFMSGILAGSITAFVTLPLDVVKTRKQVSTRRDLYVDQGAQKSTANILQQIYYTEGIKGLFRGYQPRIAKVTVHSGLVYMMYEYFKEHVFRAI